MGITASFRVLEAAELSKLRDVLGAPAAAPQPRTIWQRLASGFSSGGVEQQESVEDYVLETLLDADGEDESHPDDSEAARYRYCDADKAWDGMARTLRDMAACNGSALADDDILFSTVGETLPGRDVNMWLMSPADVDRAYSLLIKIDHEAVRRSVPTWQNAYVVETATAPNADPDVVEDGIDYVMQGFTEMIGAYRLAKNNGEHLLTVLM